MSAPIRLSIVIPMLNEEQNLGSLCAQLFPVLDGIGLSYEVIAVDDGSTDDSPALLRAEQQEHPQLRILTLARNYGQHAAIMAGFDLARGEWIITLDADLQNPPGEIPKLVDAFQKGHDMVNTIRATRDATMFRRLASRGINQMARRASGIALTDFGCMMRGYHRDLVRRMTRRQEFHTFIPALGMLYARNPVEILVAHSARERGDSKYSLWKLFFLQLDLMTSFSLSPIRMLFTVGAVIAFLGMGFGATLLVLRFVYGSEWAMGGIFTLFAILFFFVGAQFVAFGLIGEYVGRVYHEVRDRPAYVVQHVYPDDDGLPFGARPERIAEEPYESR